MKIPPILCGLAMSLLAAVALPAQDTTSGDTDQDLLNKLATPDAHAAALGARQEEFLVFERMLRGEGLPEDYQSFFRNQAVATIAAAIRTTIGRAAKTIAVIDSLCYFCDHQIRVPIFDFAKQNQRSQYLPGA